MWRPCILMLPIALASMACGEGPGDENPPDEEAYRSPSAGPSLEATFDDPILLTIAAARGRTEYLVDEGYTLTDDGALSLQTDTAGDLGVAFVVDGALAVGESTYRSPVTIHHTASDSMVLTFDITENLSAEMRPVATTSRTLSVDVWLSNASSTPAQVTVVPWLRRCDGGFAAVAQRDGGWTSEHRVDISEEEALFAAGTFVEDAAGALVMDGQGVTRCALDSCSDSLSDDIQVLVSGSSATGTKVAAMGLKREVEVPAGGKTLQRVWRTVVPEDRKAQIGDEVDIAAAFDLTDLVEEGHARLADMPASPTDERDTSLLMHSSFTLLDQLMMPPEGLLDHTYYVFSREPTWWFARLGQHAHESLSMITLAQMDCALAMDSHRVFFDRIEEDGYLPYNIGPVVETATLGTATAPFLSLVSWELYQTCGDDDFLMDAYTAGSAFHDFWVQQRDRDGDGLCEFGGFAISEATRDLNNVIWEEVASPDEVEAVDLNSWLVMEARSLSAMAGALGLVDEAETWTAAADTRAALIDATMWDETTGFYYHVDHDDNDFDISAPGDLKRMEIAGLLPLWSGIAQGERADILLQKMTDPSRFWRDHGVPSLAADDPSYDPTASSCCRWNGPVWVQWQWLMMRALQDHGQDELAAELATRVSSTVAHRLALDHQFRELYDPDDQAAPNDSMPNYIWTAMAAQMLLETR